MAAAIACCRLLSSSGACFDNESFPATQLHDLKDAAGAAALQALKWRQDTDRNHSGRWPLCGVHAGGVLAGRVPAALARSSDGGDHETERRLPLLDAVEVSDEVLERVLVVATADEDSDARHAVLCALTPNFDVHLTQSGKWELLLLALRDETVVCREAAIQLLGRMSKCSAAHVLPKLRTHLFDLLVEIEHSSSADRKEQAAHILSHLVCALPQLIRPYAARVLQVLQPQLRDSACALAALGELAVVAGSAVGPSMQTLLPQLLPLLHDQASSYKRCTALHALSQLLRATGYPSRACI
jgi:hypothetical protein